MPVDGPHNELGVIISHGRNNTFRHYNPETGEQYLVWDQLHTATEAQKVAREFNMPYLSFLNNYESQLVNATAPLIAAGKPIYKVGDADAKYLHPQLVGYVKSLRNI